MNASRDRSVVALDAGAGRVQEDIADGERERTVHRRQRLTPVLFEN